METIHPYLPELLSFYEVARAGSFTLAAQRLHLSKSQLSKQVMRLETMLAVQLFHRTTRKLSLTEEGKHLLKYAQSMVGLLREAAEEMQGFVKDEKGIIRITAPSSLGDWFGPPLLTLFREKFPKLRVELDLTNLKRDLVEDNFDFALRAMEEKDPRLIARFIGHLKDVIVATPDWIKKNKLDLSHPQNLKNQECLLNSHQESWNTWKLQKGNKEDLVLEVGGRYACSSYAATRLLCLKGLGIARLPGYLVQEDLEQKNSCAFILITPWPPIPYTWSTLAEVTIVASIKW